MKRILTQNNYVVLQEIASDSSITLQLGYAFGGITYKIENQNVKFYLKDDYFYKNCIFSADLPLNIDGIEYDEDHITEIMGNIFPANGGGGGGDVSSVNGKTGRVVLTAEDLDAYTKAEVDDLLQDIEDQITGLDEDIAELETQLNGQEEELDVIEGKIGTIEGKIQEIEGDIDALEADNTANKADIATLKDDVNNLKSRVSALETAAASHLVASNIKSGTNIAVSVSGNDVTISTVGIPTVEGLAELEEQVSANTTAIEGIQQEITGKEHFRGYFATNAEIQALTATDGDFAFSAESGTKWVYNNNAWTDTHTAVPDKTVEKSTSVPLMDGTATIGSSNKYAAADHIHPTDTTRASQSDLTALETQVQANTTAIGNKADQSDLNTLSNEVSAKANSADLATVATSGSYNDLTNKPTIPAAQVNADWDASSGVAQILNKPTIPTVPTNVSAFTNDAGYLTQHQSLANYYTKSESDDTFAFKFTDVDDIVMVSQLPSQPKARTLYLIPVQ